MSYDMIAHRRREVILEMLQRSGSVSVKRLRETLGVSAMTLWRDLRALEESPGVRRVRGGIVLEPPEPSGEPEPRFADKAALHADAKQAIARAAVQHHVRTGDVIFLEGGTTVAAMIPHLRAAVAELTILVNSVLLLDTDALGPSYTLIASGGVVRDVSQTFVGPVAEQFFRDHSADTAFISATGVTAEGGLTDPNPLEIQVKKAMLQSCRRVVALVDSSKFGRRSLTPVATWKEIDVLITDDAAPYAELETIAQHGVDIRKVPIDTDQK